MGGKEIEDFLTHLAVKENVAASTQNQEDCPLPNFLYSLLDVFQVCVETNFLRC